MRGSLLRFDFNWHPGLRPIAFISSLGSVTAMAYTIAAAQLLFQLTYSPGAWFYLLVVLAAVSGAAMPLLHETYEVPVGRFVVGMGWFLLPAVLGSSSAALADGWTWTDLLFQGVAPGVLLLTGYVVATTLGDGCALMVPKAQPETPEDFRSLAGQCRKGVTQLLATSFKAWLLLLVFDSLVAEGFLGTPTRTPILAGIFAATGLCGNVAMLALAHLHTAHVAWRGHGDEVAVEVDRIRWQDLLLVCGGVAAVALIAPANVSPIARQGLSNFFVGLNDLLAPLFVPGRRRTASSGDDGGFWQRLSELLFPGTDATGEATGSFVSFVLNALFLAVLLAAVAYAVWRLLGWSRPKGQQRDEGPGYGDRGILRELFSWLWGRLRSWFGGFTHWVGRLTGLTGGREAKKRRRHLFRRREGEEVEEGGHPVLRIRRLFARLLRDLGRAGYPRGADETPYEYAGRVSALRPDAGADLDEVVAVYVEARYSPEPPLSFLERAYAALKESVGRLLRVIRRKSVGPQ